MIAVCLCNGQQAEIGFALDEALALYLGRQFLDPLVGTMFWMAAQSAFRKIRACLNKSALDYLEEIAAHLHHTTVGAGIYSQKAELVDDLVRGIEDQMAVHIEYQSLRSTEPVTYEVCPYFGGSERVYARFVLLRSHLALKAIEPPAIELPDHLETLVEVVYGNKPLTIPDGWKTELDEAKRDLREEQIIQRMKAKGLMIYRPDDEDLLRQQNVQLDEENPEAAEAIRAATRDTEPTIQVVLVYSIDGRDYLDESGQEPFSEAHEPDVTQIRRLLDNEVTISHRGYVAYYAGRTVPTGWRKRGMLRYHRVARIDAFGAPLSTEYPMHFDRDVGIMFTRDTAEKEPR